MEVLDAKGLSERLRWEDSEYWLHLEAETPFEKYPGKPDMNVGRASS
jgi:Xaa-Pro dipeptidase